MFIRGLQRWDEAASRQPDHFVANSRAVAERIRRVYQRSAEVIHPPIETGAISSQPQPPAKTTTWCCRGWCHTSALIWRCSLHPAWQETIGDRRWARPTESGSHGWSSVSFLGRASDEEVEHHVARCRALLFPGEEDFGMAPVEVAAAGRPTIAYRAGGALETIVENVTGIFFDYQTPESLGDAIETFERLEWSPPTLRQHAKSFSVPVFQERFRSFLERIDAPVDQRPRGSSGGSQHFDRCAGLMIETRVCPAIGIPSGRARASEPGVGIVAAGCVMVVAILWFAGSGHLLRLAVPAIATLFGLFLYVRRPVLYLQYVLWCWFLAPLARRVVDLRFGWMESNVVLLAPVLVSGIAGLTLLRRTERDGGAIPVAFVLCGAAILYGFVVGVLLHPSVETAYAFLNWLCPLLFGLHLYLNWPQYQQYRDAIAALSCGRS